MPRKKQSKDIIEIDDGRTIANMNVEGMPWYTPKKREPPAAEHKWNPEERRAYNAGVFKAVLLVSSVFLIGFLAFILFCIFVWFK